MQQENVIEVNNISKKFKVFYDKGSTFKEKILFRKRRRYEERVVLEDISFFVKRGEAIGLIGHNGCGKSTTLKLLTKIIYPDRGNINISGRVSSLIELGAGFHPDMSGRENIYINASIFGLSRREIEKRLYDIITFSELEEFIDNPVRTYSSGMYMRLAFSVAIHVNAEVLLIDEILGVGDTNFQTKCFQKLREIKASGTTIVIVSHSLSQIEQICDRSIWIHDGKIKEEGIPKNVHERYLFYMEQLRINSCEKEREQEQDGSCEDKKIEEIDVNREIIEKEKPVFCEEGFIRMGTKKVIFEDIIVQNVECKRKSIFYTGDTVEIIMKYDNRLGIEEGNFGIGIFRSDGIYCYGTNVDIEFNRLVPLKEKGEIKILIYNINLLSGKYVLDVAVHSKDSIEKYDDIRNVKSFEMISGKRDDGLCRQQTEWYVDCELFTRKE